MVGAQAILHEIFAFIYIYIYIWVQVTPGLTSQKLHLV